MSLRSGRGPLHAGRPPFSGGWRPTRGRRKIAQASCVAGALAVAAVIALPAGGAAATARARAGRGQRAGSSCPWVGSSHPWRRRLVADNRHIPDLCRRLLGAGRPATPRGVHDRQHTCGAPGSGAGALHHAPGPRGPRAGETDRLGHRDVARRAAGAPSPPRLDGQASRADRLRPRAAVGGADLNVHGAPALVCAEHQCGGSRHRATRAGGDTRGRGERDRRRLITGPGTAGGRPPRAAVP